jgi:glycosyltransferase involved in cell wall biosynthesis
MDHAGQAADPGGAHPGAAQGGPRSAADRIKIAHVLPSFHIGGQERVALDLARTHLSQGHDVMAFSIDGSAEGKLGEAFRAAGVRTRNVPKGPRVDPTLVVRLALALARERVDLVHTHNPMALTYGAPAGKLARAGVVHTKHGENPERHGRRVILRRVLGAFADAFVAVSPMTAEAARASRDVPERKLRVIPNGIDVSRFGPDPAARAAVRRELGIPDDAWVVGTVGRLAAEKNQVLLVRAAVGLLGERTRLLIVGDGPEASAIGRASVDAGLAPWVHLAGAQADVPRFLAAFDLFALTSVSEGLPLVILEAMATGLPVVASAVGGIPDVVEEGVTGMLVPSGDAEALRGRLTVLSGDRARAARLGASAREVARRRYSLDTMAESYMALYRQVLATSRAGGGRPGR